MKNKDFTAAFAEINLNSNGTPSGDEMVELLRVICPQPEPDEAGTYGFSAEDVKYLDALFRRFGLRLNSSDPRFQDIPYVGEIWYRLVSVFGGFIEARQLWPQIVERRVAKWKPGFADYLHAVEMDDRDTARELAAKLNVEMLFAKMPGHLTGPLED